MNFFYILFGDGKARKRCIPNWYAIDELILNIKMKIK